MKGLVLYLVYNNYLVNNDNIFILFLGRNYLIRFFLLLFWKFVFSILKKWEILWIEERKKLKRLEKIGGEGDMRILRKKENKRELKVIELGWEKVIKNCDWFF